MEPSVNLPKTLQSHVDSPTARPKRHSKRFSMDPLEERIAPKHGEPVTSGDPVPPIIG